MITPSASKVSFYETYSEIGTVEAYAVVSTHEIASILKRFVSWAAVIATHPEVAEIFGKSSTAHIKLATELRLVIKYSIQRGIYPNVVLSSRKFKTVMMLSRISQVLEPEIHEILEKELRE